MPLVVGMNGLEGWWKAEVCRLVVSDLVLRMYAAARRSKEPHYPVLSRGRDVRVEKIQLYQRKRKGHF